MRGPLPLAEAIAAVTAAGAPRPRQRVSVTGHDALDTALVVTADDVVAALDAPGFANAGMDGYAVRADDVRTASSHAPVSLRVVGTIAAGTAATGAVAPGEAVRIFTGAAVPRGADSVIRWEDTDRGDATVQIRDARDAGRNVRPAGEDARSGDVVLRAGTRVSAAHRQWLAALGVRELVVHRPPVVALIRTGDELVPPGTALAAGAPQVIDSNGVVLRQIVLAAGGAVLDVGIVPDQRDALAAAMRDAASRADVIVTAGGVAAGDFDVTKGAAVDAGGRVDFWKIRARPGSQVAVGAIGDAVWIGMPGNPVSAAVMGELLLRPLLRAMLGDARPHRPMLPVQLAEPVARDATMTLLLRATLDDDVAPGALPRARLAGAQGSHLLGPLARADVLLVVPPGADTWAGVALDAIALHDLRGSARVPGA
ncbi:MAG: molybdopterin molybdotransferase MoeA [Gemmatimonadaceae bacterium]|nr:molybdopterin molybdotransferase MoeA [Gemmatimonadaceae bacterium]